jgi:hypothetical protein
VQNKLTDSFACAQFCERRRPNFRQQEYFNDDDEEEHIHRQRGKALLFSSLFS